MLKRILASISVYLFTVLFFYEDLPHLLIGCVVGLFFVFVLYNQEELPKRFDKWMYVVGVIVHCYVSANTFRHLLYMDGFSVFMPVESIKWKYAIAALITLFLSLPSIYGNLWVISALKEVTQLPHDKDMKRVIPISWKEVALLFLIAFSIITIFSRSSVLYPLNDWVDANCYLTVGKSILRGKLPYLDLREQKGPIFYYIHAIAALISFDSFFGVYIVEIVELFVAIFFVYKTIRFFGDFRLLYAFPLIGVIVFSTQAFCQGDSAEELVTCFYAITLYLLTKNLVKEELPGKKDSLIIGLLAGVVFWIKYTLAGFFLGCAIAMTFLCIKKFGPKAIRNVYIYVFTGFLCVTIVVLGYFAYKQALPSMFQIYFYDNLFQYTQWGERTPMWRNVFVMQFWAIEKNSLMFFLIYLGIVSMFYQNTKIGWVFLGGYLGAGLLVFAAPFYMRYYCFILSIYAWYGAIALVGIVRTLNQHIHLPKVLIGVVIFALCVLVGSRSKNLPLMFEKKENMPQFKFKDTILSKENPTLLNYGFLDGGFYTVTGIVPNCWSFNKLNVVLEDEDPLQVEFVEKGLVDFVVTSDQELKHGNYRLVDQAEYPCEDEICTYRLYQKAGE